MEGPIRERNHDLLWAARRAEKGKDWKGRTLGGNSTRGRKHPNWVDYDWNVAYDDVDADAFWDEAANVFDEEARVMDVALLDLVTRSYPRRHRKFPMKLFDALSLTSPAYRTLQGEETNFYECVEL